MSSHVFGRHRAMNEHEPFHHVADAALVFAEEHDSSMTYVNRIAFHEVGIATHDHARLSLSILPVSPVVSRSNAHLDSCRKVVVTSMPHLRSA